MSVAYVTTAQMNESTQRVYDKLVDYQESMERRREFDLIETVVLERQPSAEVNRHRRSEEQVMTMFGCINEQLESMTQLMAEQRASNAFDRRAMETRLSEALEDSVAKSLEPMISGWLALARR